MFGRKTGYHHKSFQKITEDINAFGKKNEHLHKNHKSQTKPEQSEEPKKSQYEK